MKQNLSLKKTVSVLVLIISSVTMLVTGCAGSPKVKTLELDNKGKAIGVTTPSWIKLFVSKGVTAVQEQPQFKDKYCIIGEESSINKQFALAWADSFSAQQRIGAMLRTNIESKYQATVKGLSQTTGGANSSTAAGGGSANYNQEINDVINAVVNVSYSGAQRDSDWWVLMRRYDPDQKDVFSDEYTAYVMYTVPKAELNRQIASALETSISKDSALYDITIALAKDIMLNGVNYLEPETGRDNADAKTAASTSVPDGTYTYAPRLQEMQGGVNKRGYLNRIVVQSGFIAFYLVDRPAGNGDRPGDGEFLGRNYGRDESKIILQNLDNPNRTWVPAKIDRDDETGGIYLTFQGVQGSRFSLTDNNFNPPYTFEKIIIGKPDAQ
ncbi:hypothetical protein AGMMS50212_12390 [Spirochaetia bacterium]|nr:hypothetical protein AGMMS50212_12390 [Spirochaetia bacterium]